MAAQQNSAIEQDRQLINNARSRGPFALLGAFTKLSGPGWLQSAITLGGGSLAGSLYLGVLGGFALMWLQPLAMLLGIIMLSAISYVALSTNERPFDAINRHVNPVLGWGWAIATLMANLVWSLPQFSLGVATLRQNLLPGVVGPDAMPDTMGKLICCAVLLVIAITVIWFYDSGSKGIKAFEIFLKGLVGLIVICFFGVVVKMSITGEGLAWGAIFGGFIPDPGLVMSPAKTFDPFIAAVAPEFRDFWTKMIIGQQRDIMITATATAVGINMTFLLPYSMLKRGWDKDFRGLAVFDLGTGLLIPFILVTSCVVIASASQFHTQPAVALVDDAGQPIPLAGKAVAIAEKRLKADMGAENYGALTPEQVDAQIQALPMADKKMAAMLVKRDAFDLARSLAPLTGPTFAHYVFGIGVVGMAISTIIILMLINGFVLCEMLGLPSGGWPHRIGCLMPAIGALGPFIWSGKTQFWLAVPTSVFGMVLIPIAYCAFFLVINQKNLLGENMPKGGFRLVWNVLMLIAIGLTGVGSVYSIWSRLQWTGIGIIAAFIGLALVVHFMRRGKSAG
jgi:Mn2+/Fe2+ NRAMP family transporter